MPRMRRTVVPDYPHHILQRGHNGQEVFKDEEDYLKYLADLRELKEKWHVKVYGWCLLPEQVHMLVDPGPNPDMLSELMKALAARTTRHRNRKDKRSGTLWESRSAPVWFSEAPGRSPACAIWKSGPSYWTWPPHRHVFPGPVSACAWAAKSPSGLISRKNSLSCRHRSGAPAALPSFHGTADPGSGSRAYPGRRHAQPTHR